jgi:hypothetical protein
MRQPTTFSIILLCTLCLITAIPSSAYHHNDDNKYNSEDSPITVTLNSQGIATVDQDADDTPYTDDVDPPTNPLCIQRPCPLVDTNSRSLCECGCLPRTCPSGQRLDPETCQCECRRTSCPSGQTFNTTTCGCQCNAVCNAQQILNSTTCDCKCRDKSCPLGQTQNPTTCECECANTCPSTHTLNTTTCGCGCTNKCSVGGVQNPTTCRCTCISLCPVGYVRNPLTCQCTRTCLPVFCPLSDDSLALQATGQVLCKCPPSRDDNITVTENDIFNIPETIVTTVRCEVVVYCPSDTMSVPNTLTPCPINMCVCRHVCPFGQVQNPTTCRCHVAIDSVVSVVTTPPSRVHCELVEYCPPRFRSVPNTVSSCPLNMCVCRHDCPLGYTQNSTTCECTRPCIPHACPLDKEGLGLQANGSFLCPCPPSSTNTTVVHEPRVHCDVVVYCPLSTVSVPNTLTPCPLNMCVCRRKCLPGYTQNSTTCACTRNSIV